MDDRDNKRILLADNTAEYRHSVIGFLELEGYSVSEAESLDEALEKLELEKFDLVLADLRMKNDTDSNDVSGLEVAKFASRRGTPCIMVTAFPTVELARTALRALGAKPYARDLITKASGPQALLDSISRILENMEPERQYPSKKGLFIDLDKQLVYKDGVEIRVFSTKQYDLLAHLWRKEGGICTYIELLKAVYQEDISELEAKNDTRIKKLVDRTKQNIEDDDPEHPYIATEFGRGYRLNRKP